jgi:alpha,alpha-trehalose phosphorylase
MNTNRIYQSKSLPLDYNGIVFNQILFYNSNGYIRVPYTLEEGYPEVYRIINSQYINGFSDDIERFQADKLNCLPGTKRVRLNITDNQAIRLILEGEQFSMFSGTVIDYRLSLDMNQGITVRELKWRSPKGKEVSIKIIRMVSHYLQSLYLIEYEVIPLNFTAEVVFESVHDGNATNYFDEQDPRYPTASKKYLTPISHEQKDGVSFVTYKDSSTGLEVCSCVKNVLSQPYQSEISIQNNQLTSTLKTFAKKNNRVKLTKYSIFCDSLRSGNCSRQAQEDLGNALSIPIDAFYRKQEFYLHMYWKDYAKTRNQSRAQTR